ncbi:hypothetical protein V6B14_22410 (plasmid) [Sporosarcina psychrophila]|uniref:hypothetical protein n=1 Tax=Sporosarcina psychrophila TaxID=1476 RepID=UPI0030CC89E1
MSERVNKPVSFNISDPYEKELLDFALGQRKYFSRYIKRLIEQDRLEKSTPPQVAKLHTETIDTSEEENRNAVSGFF